MIPTFAIGTCLMILFCGLTLDAGLLQLKKLQMQSAADAAALGAELAWERGNDTQVAQGKADAAVNGFTDGTQGVTVNVYWPPDNGGFSGFYDTMEVKITQNVKTIFMGALNGGMVSVTAQAGALMPPCGYAMATTGLSGTYAFSGTNTQVNNDAGTDIRCPMYVNKNVYLDSLSNLDAYALNVTKPSTGSSLSGSYFPSPRFGASAMTDPLAAISAPTFSSCTKTSYSVTSGSATLNPGTYCGTSSKLGMTFSNATVTLNPGLYIVTGGAHWTNSNVSGTGVTLYFTKGNGASYGQVVMDNNSKVSLSAPVDSSNGGIPTILFFGDRNWVHTAAQDFQLNSALFSGDGIWYITGTGLSLTFAGSLYAQDYLGVVADSFYNDSSTIGLFSDFSMIPTGNPFRTQAVLVQ